MNHTNDWGLCRRGAVLPFNAVHNSTSTAVWREVEANSGIIFEHTRLGVASMLFDYLMSIRSGDHD